jgi:hypothetical protein
MAEKKNNFKYKVSISLLFLFISIILISPIQALAEDTTASGNPSAAASGSTWTGIVPCGNGDTPCTLCDLISGIKSLVEWGLGIVFVVATAGIVIAGIMYIISTGNEGMMTQAKSFLTVSLVGFFIVLGAWLLVNITITWLLPTDISGATGKANWYSFGKLECGSNMGKPSSSSASPSASPSQNNANTPTNTNNQNNTNAQNNSSNEYPVMGP